MIVVIAEGVDFGFTCAVLIFFSTGAAAPEKKLHCSAEKELKKMPTEENAYTLSLVCFSSCFAIVNFSSQG